MQRSFQRSCCLLVLFFLSSCSNSTPATPLELHFYVYRSAPPALLEFSQDFQTLGEIPLSMPANCGMFNLFPAPVGEFIAIELSCPNGQTVLLLDTNSAVVSQPITDTDSHFLTWASDGKEVYLKVDSLGNAHIARLDTKGGNQRLPIPEFTYDLSVDPAGDNFTFTFSRGLGQGSELWLARRDGKAVGQLYADLFHYIAFARYAPDGGQIAFIKIPDTQTSFTVGELWVMNPDGSEARKLADADAGHGYAANWSPDGRMIAFVVRENAEDERADRLSEALISNIYIVHAESGELIQVTQLEDGWAETPFWSPDGNTLAFNAVVNDRMEVQIADVHRVVAGGDSTVEILPLIVESTCCPVWLRK